MHPKAKSGKHRGTANGRSQIDNTRECGQMETEFQCKIWGKFDPAERSRRPFMSCMQPVRCPCSSAPGVIWVRGRRMFYQASSLMPHWEGTHAVACLRSTANPKYPARTVERSHYFEDLLTRSVGLGKVFSCGSCARSCSSTHVGQRRGYLQ